MTMAPANLAYTRHLITVAYEGGAASILASFTPCSWSYGELGRAYAPKRPIARPAYDRWFEFFSGAEYWETLEAGKSRLDRLCAGLGEAEMRRVSDIFRVSTQLEYLFWDMADSLTKDQMLAVVESGDMQIADCRMDSTWYAAGAHIPGAVRLPAPALVEPENGMVHDAAGVRRQLAEARIDADRPIALYCGGGVSAAEAFLALHTAGIQTARVYDGSWTEWGADPATPKAPHSNR
jgi:rhodanese-related sulfurtransferase